MHACVFLYLCSVCVPFSVRLSKCNHFFSPVLQRREGVPAEETQYETIEKLRKRLDKANSDLDKLTNENQSLKARKLLLENKNRELEAEMNAKNNEAEKLKARLNELQQQTNKLEEENGTLKVKYQKEIKMLQTKLEDALKASHKDFRKSLQQAGEICEKNCVVSCLVCACQLKLQDVHLCYDHLARIILHDEEDICYLQCGSYLKLLVKKKLVKRKKKIEYSSDTKARDKQIDEIWEVLKTTTDAKIMILGRKMVANDEARGEARHALLCDVEDRMEEDKLALYDLQRRECGRGTKENLKYYLKEDKGINLYTLNLDSLKTLIKKKRNLVEETCCKSGISNDWIDTAVNIFRNSRKELSILSV